MESAVIQRLTQHLQEEFAIVDQQVPSATPWDERANLCISLFQGSFYQRPAIHLGSNRSFAKDEIELLHNVDATLHEANQLQQRDFLAKVVGRSLPRPLRRWLWHKMLYNPKHVEDNHWRLKANQTIMAVSQPWLSPLATMIFRLVRETLHDDFRAYSDIPEIHERLAAILNQLYVLARQQSSHFVALALPLTHLFDDLDAQ